MGEGDGSGSTQDAKSAGVSADQETSEETDQGGVVGMLKRMATKSLEENLQAVFDCIMVNIVERHHMPSAKLICDLAMLVSKGHATQETYQSFSTMLGKILQGEVVSVTEVQEDESAA